ncbi:hypothetical protein SASPL_126854 [Salvia splendens]|uniref:Uncharacterized protein n=1 Tax=Salvia splendens TaxID=180675 RepID=A0A8X8XML5_SALSN|nr:hypothetical protein SASPL_126854 [Salvia splendens]
MSSKKDTVIITSLVIHQHRRPPPLQLQLWLLLPDLPQLHLHPLPQPRPRPAPQISLPIPPHRHARPRLLRLISLRYLPVSFNTPFFTALFAYLITRKREAWATYTYHHCQWVVDCREKLNSMNLMLYVAPVAVVVLLPAALVMELGVFVLGNAKGAVAVVISILNSKIQSPSLVFAGYTMTVMGVIADGESKRRQK